MSCVALLFTVGFLAATQLGLPKSSPGNFLERQPYTDVSSTQPPKLMANTGILVHGAHLEADAWDDIVWGEAPHRMGRLPHAVLMAWQERASVVIIGGGGSQRNGLTEGEYTLRYLWKRWAELQSFEALAHAPLAELKQMMERVILVDGSSVNTEQEIDHALRAFSSRGVSRAILISSPTHLPRSVALASKLMSNDASMPFHGTVMASPSATCYSNTTAADVVVVEPPHRGDRDKSLDLVPLHQLVRRSLKVADQDKLDFLEAFQELLEEYGV